MEWLVEMRGARIEETFGGGKEGREEGKDGGWLAKLDLIEEHFGSVACMCLAREKEKRERESQRDGEREKDVVADTDDLRKSKREEEKFIVIWSAEEKKRGGERERERVGGGRKTEGEKRGRRA